MRTLTLEPRLIDKVDDLASPALRRAVRDYGPDRVVAYSAPLALGAPRLELAFDLRRADVVLASLGESPPIRLRVSARRDVEVPMLLGELVRGLLKAAIERTGRLPTFETAHEVLGVLFQAEKAAPPKTERELGEDLAARVDLLEAWRESLPPPAPPVDPNAFAATVARALDVGMKKLELRPEIEVHVEQPGGTKKLEIKRDRDGRITGAEVKPLETPATTLSAEAAIAAVPPVPHRPDRRRALFARWEAARAQGALEGMSFERFYEINAKESS